LTSLPMASPFPVDGTLGAAFVGFSFSCVAFGVITNQTYTYFQRYPADKIAYKLIVCSYLYLNQLIDQILIEHAVYFYTITCVSATSIFAFGTYARIQKLQPTSCITYRARSMVTYRT
ncbi:hypothetical protein B0H14DRAFT_2378845, partial [Mycena olivaceomarginata]